MNEAITKMWQKYTFERKCKSKPEQNLWVEFMMLYILNDKQSFRLSPKLQGPGLS